MKRCFDLRFVTCLVMSACLTGQVLADGYMGEYQGTFHPDKVLRINATAKVVAEGGGNYRIVLAARPDDPSVEGAFVEINGREEGSQVKIDDLAGGYKWTGEITDGRLNVKSEYGLYFELGKIESKSPNAGLKPPANAVVLLAFEAGKAPDMSQWTNTGWEALEDGSMQCVPKKGSNRTNQQFGDIKQFHIEFKLPLEPTKRGQGRANSGVYLNDAYEVQVLDSFGLVHTSGDCGGIYNLARARVNACLPPEVWQTYDITFTAPRMDESGNVRQQPRITVVHNGVKIHDNLEIQRSGHRARGRIQLQDHGHKIQFRNIWVVE